MGLRVSQYQHLKMLLVVPSSHVNTKFNLPTNQIKYFKDGFECVDIKFEQTL